MFAHLHKDIVVYSAGTSKDLYILSDSYLKASDDASVKLRESFFAVMLHGVAGAAVTDSPTGEQIEWYFAELSEKIKHAYKYEGKNRAVLMLSCYAGFGMARSLALNLQLPVVAGRSAVTIEGNGTIKCLEMADKSRNSHNPNLNVGNRLDWVFASPGGQIEVYKKAILDKPTAIRFAEKLKR